MSPVIELFVAAAAAGLLTCSVLAGELLSPAKGGTSLPVKLTLNSFKMCPDHLNVPSTYDDLSLYMDPEFGHTLFVEGVLNIKEEIPEGTVLVVDVRRCYDERDVSCEKYVQYEIPDICSYMPKDDEPWSEFVSQIEGLIPKCPIQPGSYKMNESPVDLSRYQNQSEAIGHWQCELSFAKQPKLYGCIMLDMTVSLR